MAKAIPSVSENFEFNDDVNYQNTQSAPAIQYNNNQQVPDLNNQVQGSYNLKVETNNFQDGLGSNNVSVQNLGNIELFDLVQMLIVYSFIIAAALAAVFIFVGGISFILSGGDDEKIKKAVNTIRYSIIGLIITILSFTFITIIGKIFKLDLLKYISFSSIKAQIEQVLPEAPVEDNRNFQIRR